MISSTSHPKNIRALGNQISKKSTSTPYAVVEVFSKGDKGAITSQFERYLRSNGHFSVVFIGESK